MSALLTFPTGPVDVGAPYVMTAGELTTSLIAGVDRTAMRLPLRKVEAPRLRMILEDVLVPALAHPPCVIAFSGGRDSSGLLALAARVARHHGLRLPIPATNRFPGMTAVDEVKWQEMVVNHIGVDDWIRVDITDEVDLVGPLASSVLKRFGVLWPPNSHFLGTLLDHCKGGTLITGLGGDELLGRADQRLIRLLTFQIKPGLGDLRTAGAATLPRAVRTRLRMRHVDRLPWLRPAAAEEHARALAGKILERFSWAGTVADWWQSRVRLATVASMAAVTGSHVRVEHPFMSPQFAGAAVGTLWRSGFRSREDAMELLFGHVLPRAICERRDKAAFFEPFVNRHSRAFIDAWDGRGVDEAVVDVEALRRTWSEPEVDARSYALLQSIWLANSVREPRREILQGRLDAGREASVE